MAADSKLDQAQLDKALEDLDGWDIVDGKLHKVFEFSDFSEALGWMVRAGIEAERIDHHPEWSNVWNKVTVDLVTHSADGLTKKDLDLAARMNGLGS